MGSPAGCVAEALQEGADLTTCAVPLPEGRVLLASADTTGEVLPDDAAVWLQG